MNIFKKFTLILIISTTTSMTFAQGQKEQTDTVFDTVKQSCNTKIWNLSWDRILCNAFISGVYAGLPTIFVGEAHSKINQRIKHYKNYDIRSFDEYEKMMAPLKISRQCFMAATYVLSFYLISRWISSYMTPEGLASLTKEERTLFTLIIHNDPEVILEKLIKACKRNGISLAILGRNINTLNTKIDSILNSLSSIKKYQSESFDELKDTLLAAKDSIAQVMILLRSMPEWQIAQQQQVSDTQNAMLEQLNAQTTLQIIDLVMRRRY